jgi:hypothetical protein
VLSEPLTVKRLRERARWLSLPVTRFGIWEAMSETKGKDSAGDGKRKTLVGTITLLFAIVVAVVLAVYPWKTKSDGLSAASVAPAVPPSATTELVPKREPIRLAERCKVLSNIIDTFVGMNVVHTEEGKQTTTRKALRLVCVRKGCELHLLDLRSLDDSGLLTGYEFSSFDGTVARREDGIVTVRFSSGSEHVVVIDPVKQFLVYKRRTAEFEEEGSSTCGVE